MFDRGKRFKRPGPHSQGTASRSFEISIIGRQFQVGEFPQMGVHHAGGSLANEEEAAPLRNERNEPAPCSGDAPAEAGQLTNTALSASDAVFRDGTNAAPGLSGRADERAQFHQRLVEL